MSNVVNYNLNRRIRQALYVLKRAFGSTVTLYKLVDETTNYTTGVTTSSTLNTTIPRCIVLPVRLQREVIQAVSEISANKTFAYGGGGAFESGTREFVIDSHDLPPGYAISLDAWIIYDDIRYEIKNISQLEQNTGWHITGKAILGPPIAKEASATTVLNFTEGTDNE
ncbi:hypothetical protein M0R72_15475 [Candidatus Pacearchaeota archaeon]|jgi:hypothetical protein|nr:hypothetical protein [Candidatus Pacearchaeota archaeon]